MGACAGSAAGRRQRKWLERAIAAAVDEALETFHGTRSTRVGDRSDERLWAVIARRIGYANMHCAVIDCAAEMRDERRPLPFRDQPRYFQAFLNRHYPRTKGGAR